MAAEAFADRTYQPDATLTPRTRPGALIEDIDASLEQVRRMVQEGKVIALDGSALPIEIDTLCIHGDQPGAVAFARRIRAELSALGVEVRAAGAR